MSKAPLVALTGVTTMKLKFFTIAIAYWIVIIVIAHFFPPPGYVWTRNTISDLASQGHAYKWIMQAGMIGFGILITLAIGFTVWRMKRMSIHLPFIALYGFAILLSGIFCDAPIDPSIPYSISDARLHSLFATVAGLSLSMAILCCMFNPYTRHEKLMNLFFLIVTMILSASFGLAENNLIGIGQGIIQRLLYLGGFGWLVYQEMILEKNVKPYNTL
jgi:hypothetical membrane protein